jgi:hypothetical protein
MDTKSIYINKLGASLKDDTTDNKQTEKRQTKMPTLRKIKRSAMPSPKPSTMLLKGRLTI